jgi:hypothetical protein
MLFLIVKKDIGTKGFQKWPLGHATQKDGFINTDIPSPQGSDYTLMCWS